MNGSSFPLDFSAISFLIVDDQPFTRRIVRSILHGFGSREVYEAANCDEALELARTVMPHIIITDLIMPILSGVKLIGLLKALEFLPGRFRSSSCLAISPRQQRWRSPIPAWTNCW